jgi:hypothetical protein
MGNDKSNISNINKSKPGNNIVKKNNVDNNIKK